MKKLITIQKREKLNEVYAIDEVGPGGAHHRYAVIPYGKDAEEELHYGAEAGKIQFQCGPRNEDKSLKGVIDSDLLEIVRDRLKGFQSGEFATEENVQALIHIEEALMWLNRRVEDRIERNVLGTSQQ